MREKKQDPTKTWTFSSIWQALIRTVLVATMATGSAHAAHAQGDRNPGSARGDAAETTSDAAASTEKKDAAETEEISSLRQALYTAVRRARSSSGARKVDRDEGFETSARRHARDMVERRYMDHRSPDGDGPRERVLAIFPDFIGIAGENIAMRSVRPDEDADDTALAAVEAWTDSPPHRKILLDQRHGHVGSGVADNGRATYIVLLLASAPSYRPPPPPEPRPEPETVPGSEDVPAGTKPAENKAESAPGS
ncbi:MAG: CAP domain-containing protein [Candidatus Phaeomarinobacter sp.]